MLPQLSAAVRVFLCTRPTDLRKGFDGLSGLVRECFSQDLLTGHLACGVLIKLLEPARIGFQGTGKWFDVIALAVPLGTVGLKVWSRTFDEFDATGWAGSSRTGRHWSGGPG